MNLISFRVVRFPKFVKLVVLLWKPWPEVDLKMFIVTNHGLAQPRSQGPLSSYLEKVPWLRLVTCPCIQIKSAPGVGLWINCVNTVYGGESCFASCLTDAILKLSKLFVRHPAWPVLRFYQNFYEYEMMIEREVCLFSLHLPVSD